MFFRAKKRFFTTEITFIFENARYAQKEPFPFSIYDVVFYYFFKIKLAMFVKKH